MDGLQKIVDLQKDGTLVCQPTDKTGGFALMNREDYIEEMMILLTDTSIDKTGAVASHYNPVTWEAVVSIYDQICEILDAGLKSGEISEFEHSCMRLKEHGCIYGLVKDHKETTRKIPPLRPICSGNGTMTEQISKRQWAACIFPRVHALAMFDQGP